jgi:hypothetical protein
VPTPSWNTKDFHLHKDEIFYIITTSRFTLWMYIANHQWLLTFITTTMEQKQVIEVRVKYNYVNFNGSHLAIAFYGVTKSTTFCRWIQTDSNHLVNFMQKSRWGADSCSGSHAVDLCCSRASVEACKYKRGSNALWMFIAIHFAISTSQESRYILYSSQVPYCCPNNPLLEPVYSQMNKIALHCLYLKSILIFSFLYD